MPKKLFAHFTHLIFKYKFYIILLVFFFLLVSVSFAAQKTNHAIVQEKPTRGNSYQVYPLIDYPKYPAPVDFDCPSWKPILEYYGIPYEQAERILYRESRCSFVHNYNPRTRDDSWGPLQVNRYGYLADWWDSAGYTADVFTTVDGAVAAAGALYAMCGWGPWTKPYNCNGTYLSVPSPRWDQWP